jgi:hypothetical protein
MDQTSRFKAAIAAAFMEQSEEGYARSRNPIHLWRLYAVARQTEQPLPRSVLTYLDRVALALTAPDGPTSPQAVAAALGLATKGGPSKTKRAITEGRDLDVVARMRALQDLARRFPGTDPSLQDPMGILDRVAVEYGLSVERVQGIYYAVTGTARQTRQSTSTSTAPARRPKSTTKAVRSRRHLRRRSRRKNSRSS